MTFRAASPACPACGALVSSRVLFDVAVLRCPSCNGAWLDGLAMTAASLDRREPRAPTLRALLCVRCGAPLTEPDGLHELAACGAGCGVFVAAAAAEALLSRTGHGTLPPPAPHLVRILAIVRALEREPRSESPS